MAGKQKRPGRRPGPLLRIAALAALLLTLLLIAGGWRMALALVGGPHLRDLRLKGVEVAWAYADATSVSNAPPTRVIEVTFTAGRDLSIYGRLYQSNLVAIVGLCRDGTVDMVRRLGSREVRTPDGRYASHGVAADSGKPHAPDASGRYPYRLGLYFRTEPHPDPAVASGLVAHDHRLQAGDVCFRLSGGPTIGRGFESDTVVIPYALIAAALARAGLPHAAPP